jgi:hypothetical protein
MIVMTPELLSAAFKNLDPLLSTRPLKRENGKVEIVAADEFMLMGDENGVQSFKHRDTRNYVYVRSVLEVPETDQSFRGGKF